MNSTRRSLLCLAGAAIVPALAPFAALAKDRKPPHIVWLVQQPARPDQKMSANDRETAKGIRAAFASVGLVDGRDLALTFAEIPNAPGGGRQLSFSAETEALIARIIASRPAAIVTVARPELELLRRATREVPVVFYNLGMDPSKVGLVASLRRPGGNITGTHLGWLDIQSRQWQLLKELVPSMKRAGMISPKVPEAVKEAFRKEKQVWAEAMREVSSRLQFEIVEIEVAREASEQEVVEALRKARVDVVNADPYATTPAVLSALKRLKLPACGHSIRHVRQGLLMGITFDYTEGQNHAVTIVARILRGEHPSTIPVYQTTRYSLNLNRGTARAIGVTFPESILLQAEEIFD